MPIFKGSMKKKTQIHIAAKNYNTKILKMTGNHCEKMIVAGFFFNVLYNGQHSLASIYLSFSIDKMFFTFF